MNLKELLTHYDNLESELLYNKAKQLFDLITDSELENLMRLSPENSILIELSNKSTEAIKKNKNLLQRAIDLFITTIESRNLTEDEFNAMTLDDIKDYINSIIIDKRSILLGVINRIEDLYK